MIYARQPAGFALGGLGGSYPAPAIGLPPAVGPAYWDEFVPDHGAKAKSLYGDLDWVETTIGSALSIQAVQPSTWNEIGILGCTTASSANRGGTLSQGSIRPLYRMPPPGSTFACKVRITSGTTNYEFWSGFSSSISNRVGPLDLAQFVGVRATGGNLFGVYKSGAGVESTVDFGFSIEGTTWHQVGFEVIGDTSAPQVQFFQLSPSASDPEVWDRQDVGTPRAGITISTGLFPIALGILTTDAVQKTAEIDYWAWGGRTAR